MFSLTIRGGSLFPFVAPPAAASTPTPSVPAVSTVKPDTAPPAGARTDHVDGAVEVTLGGNATTALYPGVSSPIDVNFTNIKSAPVSVSSLSVSIASVDAPRATAARPCSPADYSITQPSASLAVTVQGKSATSLSLLSIPITSWPQVNMINAPHDQGGCANAKLILKYTAVGVTQ